MMTTEEPNRLRAMIAKLSGLSIRDRYNPYQTFKWPEALADEQMWMSADLLTTHGTESDMPLDEAQRQRLSRWESINFYSLNVHGIRELLAEVVLRIHAPGYEDFSPFMHHFIGEENDHMWFFAEFCLRYGGKLYPNRNVNFGQRFSGRALDLVTFAKIQLFEEIVDHFNMRVAGDSSIHPFIRELNGVHHRDESRHIAFGREMVLWLYEQISREGDEALLAQIDEYLRGYMVNSVTQLYNPIVYQDALLPGNVYERRTALLQHPARRGAHRAIVRKPESFLLKHAMISKPVFAD
ncbi:MAG: diiron oxygenase [Ramlibacter sp.]|nr:diiron oxygenase [Ramlibacter sp.]